MDGDDAIALLQDIQRIDRTPERFGTSVRLTPAAFESSYGLAAA